MKKENCNNIGYHGKNSISSQKKEFELFLQKQCKILAAKYTFLTDRQIKQRAVCMWKKMKSNTTSECTKRVKENTKYKDKSFEKTTRKSKTAFHSKKSPNKSPQLPKHRALVPLQIDVVSAPKKSVLKRSYERNNDKRRVSFNSQPEVQYCTESDESTVNIAQIGMMNTATYKKNSVSKMEEKFDILLNEKCTWSYRKPKGTNIITSARKKITNGNITQIQAAVITTTKKNRNTTADNENNLPSSPSEISDTQSEKRLKIEYKNIHRVKQNGDEKKQETTPEKYQLSNNELSAISLRKNHKRENKQTSSQTKEDKATRRNLRCSKQINYKEFTSSNDSDGSSEDKMILQTRYSVINMNVCPLNSTDMDKNNFSKSDKLYDNVKAEIPLHTNEEMLPQDDQTTINENIDVKVVKCFDNKKKSTKFSMNILPTCEKSQDNGSIIVDSLSVEASSPNCQSGSDSDQKAGRHKVTTVLDQKQNLKLKQHKDEEFDPQLQLEIFQRCQNISAEIQSVCEELEMPQDYTEYEITNNILPDKETDYNENTEQIQNNLSNGTQTHPIAAKSETDPNNTYDIPNSSLLDEEYLNNFFNSNFEVDKYVNKKCNLNHSVSSEKQQENRSFYIEKQHKINTKNNTSHYLKNSRNRTQPQCENVTKDSKKIKKFIKGKKINIQVKYPEESEIISSLSIEEGSDVALPNEKLNTQNKQIQIKTQNDDFKTVNHPEDKENSVFEENEHSISSISFITETQIIVNQTYKSTPGQDYSKKEDTFTQPNNLEMAEKIVIHNIRKKDRNEGITKNPQNKLYEELEFKSNGENCDVLVENFESPLSYKSENKDEHLKYQKKNKINQHGSISKMQEKSPITKVRKRIKEKTSRNPYNKHHEESESAPGNTEENIDLLLEDIENSFLHENHEENMQQEQQSKRKSLRNRNRIEQKICKSPYNKHNEKTERTHRNAEENDDFLLEELDSLLYENDEENMLIKQSKSINLRTRKRIMEKNSSSPYCNEDTENIYGNVEEDDSFLLDELESYLQHESDEENRHLVKQSRRKNLKSPTYKNDHQYNGDLSPLNFYHEVSDNDSNFQDDLLFDFDINYQLEYENMTKFTNNKTIIPKQKYISKKKTANNAMHNWLNISKDNNNNFKLIDNKINEKPKTWESLEEKLLSSSGVMSDTTSYNESKLKHTETELHDHGYNTQRNIGNRNLSRNKSEPNLFTNILNDKQFTQDKVADITKCTTFENNNTESRKSKLKSNNILKKAMKAMDRSVVLYQEKIKSPQLNKWSKNKDFSINTFSESHDNNTVLQIQSSMLLAVEGSKMLKQTSDLKKNYTKQNPQTGFETKWPLPPARKSNRTHSIKVREESEIKNMDFKLDNKYTKGKDNSILDTTEFNVSKYSSPKRRNSHKNRYHKDKYLAKRKCAGDVITTGKENIVQEKQKITDEIINSVLEDIESKVTCNEPCSTEREEKNYNITVAKCGLNQQGKNKQKTFKKYVNEISKQIKTTKENNTGNDDNLTENASFHGSPQIKSNLDTNISNHESDSIYRKIPNLMENEHSLPFERKSISDTVDKNYEHTSSSITQFEFKKPHTETFFKTKTSAVKEDINTASQKYFQKTTSATTNEKSSNNKGYSQIQSKHCKSVNKKLCSPEENANHDKIPEMYNQHRTNLQDNLTIQEQIETEESNEKQILNKPKTNSAENKTMVNMNGTEINRSEQKFSSFSHLKRNASNKTTPFLKKIFNKFEFMKRDKNDNGLKTHRGNKNMSKASRKYKAYLKKLFKSGQCIIGTNCHENKNKIRLTSETKDQTVLKQDNAITNETATSMNYKNKLIADHEIFSVSSDSSTFTSSDDNMQITPGSGVLCDFFDKE
ncbi:putative uncharacterized protein DDB_G0282133 [Stegodyphus dumicola]|uniref:putative uncharacterized protein DDB_G0282133 n=1 Tax=Stegodyphus dumicola TaxID=202533 RepID=UPI0015AA927B|nr:putative uncharacterized protein DDB_G0282133 [Stegodyphus dumicola]